LEGADANLPKIKLEEDEDEEEERDAGRVRATAPLLAAISGMELMQQGGGGDGVELETRSCCMQAMELN
jgi:hypothetical protein